MTKFAIISMQQRLIQNPERLLTIKCHIDDLTDILLHFLNLGYKLINMKIEEY